MPIVSGLIVPKMFPLIHSMRDVYMAQYVMNVFLELTNNHSTFQKVTEVHFCFKKSHLKVTRKRKSTCEKLVSAWFSPWTSQGLTEKICRRYKTKGTPQYSIREAPIDCEYFSLNRTIAEKISKEFKNVVAIERDMNTINKW